MAATVGRRSFTHLFPPPRNVPVIYEEEKVSVVIAGDRAAEGDKHSRRRKGGKVKIFMSSFFAFFIAPI